MTSLIGLVGAARAGKSTVAALLGEMGYDRVSLGDPLKHLAYAVWGFNSAQLWGDDREADDPRYGYSPRMVLQTLGNDIVNRIDPAALTYRVERIIRANPRRRIVLDDVRHPAQAEFVRREGGLLWEVRAGLGDSGVRPHSSEDVAWILGGEPPDAVITNPRTDAVRAAVAGLLGE